MERTADPRRRGTEVRVAIGSPVRVRKAIEINGIVQGVGFRPYVFRLASETKLGGFITNTPAGVSIEVEGPEAAVGLFLERLPAEVPPLARITSLAVQEIPANHDEAFRILPSRVGDERRALISPDVAICDDCRRELFDPANRRFRYPFINCTNCGPRYTIVRDIPYDRAKTSMSVFPMCPECQRECDDPLDRRFHAQPNACWVCGPRVELWAKDGRVIEVADPVVRVVELLAAGEIVAIKGLGGFHLAVDARNDASVRRLRERKRRVEKPFAVMARDLDCIEQFCHLDEVSRRLLETPAHPIVLLEKKLPERLAPAVAPFSRDLGVFLPYTPLHRLLFAVRPGDARPGASAARPYSALVMTSGNISEEPIAIDNQEAVERLRGIADYFLVHNREILLRSDDSVLRVQDGRARQVRRSRGYVPTPVFLREELPPVLGVGGELKNTICFTRDREAFLSQHIGNMENVETFKFFEATVRGLARILEIEPKLLAYDLHPDYFSTRWALAQEGIPRVGVQHHHAHIASCMAENHLEGRVLGFALDGTGYGLDGNVWGGEVLAADYRDFDRLAHLEYVRMPGGSAAILEPRRMAISYLYHHFGRDLWKLDTPFTRGLERARTETLLRLIESGTNSPLTSSTGRLFDAVAAMAGIREHVNYEAQAAIELEAVLEKSTDDRGYPFAIHEVEAGWVIDTRPMFQALADDLRSKIPAGRISRSFHLGFVEALARTAEMARVRTGLARVCLSGGSFQNLFLVQNLRARLEAAGFQVFTHAEVPTGDGGLCLGQALVAAHRSGRSNQEGRRSSSP